MHLEIKNLEKFYSKEIPIIKKYLRIKDIYSYLKTLKLLLHHHRI